ncbi:MAG: DUF4271 domain-containing protein [Spirosomataceae bacterium]
MTIRYQLFLFLAFFQVTFGYSNSRKEITGYIVHDFVDDWRIYDYDENKYVPYLAEQHSNSPVHSIIFNLSEYKGYQIRIKVEQKNTYLFINGSLQRKVNPEQPTFLSVDSLTKIYGQGSFLITIYGDKDVTRKQVVVFNPSAITTQKSKSESLSDTSLKPRGRLTLKTPISLVFLFVVILFSYLTTSFPKASVRFFNLRDLLTFLTREQTFLINKPLNGVNTLFILLLSHVLVILYLSITTKEFGVLQSGLLLQIGDDWSTSLINYFRLLFLFFLSFVLKYFYIALVGKLFNLDKIIEIHFFKIIQASLITYSLLLISTLPLLLGYIILPDNWVIWLQVFILIFYGIRLIILYFTIIRNIPVQILYLISYLCIVELLPLLVGARLAF